MILVLTVFTVWMYKLIVPITVRKVIARRTRQFLVQSPMDYAAAWFNEDHERWGKYPVEDLIIAAMRKDMSTGDAHE